MATDQQVERALGYTPCVCGVLDGTWHSECYRGKTKQQIKAGYKLAMEKAREFLKESATTATQRAITRSTHGEQNGN